MKSNWKIYGISLLIITAGFIFSFYIIRTARSLAFVQHYSCYPGTCVPDDNGPSTNPSCGDLWCGSSSPPPATSAPAPAAVQYYSCYGGGPCHPDDNSGTFPDDPTCGGNQACVVSGTPKPSPTSTPTPAPAPAAVTVSLSASPGSVSPGQHSYLAWSSTNAQHCVLYVNGQDTGWRGLSQSNVDTGALYQTNTYRVDCINSTGGYGSDSVTVSVSSSTSTPAPTPTPTPAPVSQVTVSISASPNPVAYNTQSYLAWSSTNAQHCVLYVNDQDTGWRGLSQSNVATGNLTHSNTYRIDCINSAGGYASDSVVVSVNSTPTATLSAGATSVPYNTGTSLYWISSNTSDCSLYVNGAFTGWTGTSQSGVSTGNITGTNKYTLSCAGISSGTATSEVTVSAQAPPNKPPVGNLDPISCDYIGGWAFDPNTPDNSISVHIYDGGAGPGTLITGVTADGDRPDVRAAYGISGNHGFTIITPKNLKDAKNHYIYAYGIDSSGNPSFNSDLDSSPQTLNCPPPVGTVTIYSNKPNTAFYLRHPGGEVIGDRVDANGNRVYNGYELGAYSMDSIEQLAGYVSTFSPQSGNLSIGGTLPFNITYTRKPPTASITCNGSSLATVPYGGSATIDWSSTYAQSCTVSPTGWSGTSGSESTGPLFTSQTYNVSCPGFPQ